MISFDVMEHGRPLQQRLRDTPQPKGREVVVRITHSGVCHSDVHFMHGYIDLGGGKRQYLKDRGIVTPITLGHEPLGMVSALGPEAVGAEVGQKRLVYPWLGCGTCWACQQELTTLCVRPNAIGVARPGAFATHLVVPDAKYLVKTDGVDDAFAATLACSGVTSYSAIQKALSRVREGDWVAIVGCGGLGLLAISILRARGFEKIIACDVDDTKLQTAMAQGAAKTLRTDSEGATAKLTELAEGRLGGVADFVGRPETFSLAYPAVRRGGAYALVGLYGGEIQVPLAPIAQRGIAILGSYVGTLDDLVAVVELARNGKLRPIPITVRPAQDVNEALLALENNRAIGRTVLDFSKVEADA